MKLTKRVIFVFVYQQCHQKGFRELVTSFKMPVFLIEVVLGLISISVEVLGNNDKMINNLI